MAECREDAAVIIGFARHLSGGTDLGGAEREARSRAWLDQDGNATRDGLELVRSLRDQAGTRTALRNIV